MRGKPISITLITIFLLSLIISCKKEESVKNNSYASAPSERGFTNHESTQRRVWEIETKSVHLSDKEREVIRIETDRVVHKNIQNYLTAMGKIIAPPTSISIISYAFPARVSEIKVKAGDWVKKEDLLIVLQSEEVGRAKAEYFKALADMELANKNYERQKRLLEHGAGTRKEFLTTEAELKIAMTNLEIAEKKLHLLGFSEEGVLQIREKHEINPVINLYSPIKGKVAELKVVIGEMVDQGKEIMTIFDPRILWVEAEIPEKDIGKVALGQRVEINVSAYPETSFFGYIKNIGDIVKEETRTVWVRTEVENKDLRLKPGMFATLKIILSDARPVLVVPEEAVLDEKGEKFVFVVEGEDYQPRNIVVGVKQDRYYEVVSGLNEGEVVVTKGSFQLKSKLFQTILKSAIHD